ncbi:DNA topoisomerase [Chryseobacterium sp.]|uniref:type IA DNA topoisomerase n=1 Tax=Chryseobacterium sp. TaxID=1871047 RepID=UPI00289E08F1|nr:DNA topoisomerase [Chryseobacterium sp.]
MKTVIAEKPSVAREIASILGATEKKDGYFTGNGYCVTWALGHLITLAMPKEYGIQGYDKSVLPIMPDPFLLIPRKVEKAREYVKDAGAYKQLKVIEKLLNECERIIVATDAGREGELIFRYIYEYLNCKKPFDRLWISSLTENAIVKGFENLKAGSDFNCLHHAALGRSRADWLLGINASQALTLTADEGIYSLGRVQTPPLALICKRYEENTSFKSKKFWQLKLTHQKGMEFFSSVSELKFEELKKAENLLKVIERNNANAFVEKIEKQTLKDHPPLLFDLTGLQKEANRKLNISATETLEIAQSLYEKKFITYPRTGSKYISEDTWTEIPKLIQVLKEKESFTKAVDFIKIGQLNKKIVNDLKVTDHHGLLITEKIPSALSAKENAIYDMIAFRLLEALSDVCIKEKTELSLEILHYSFKAKGIKVTAPGWRLIQGNFSDNESEDLQQIPEITQGEELKIKKSEVLEKKSQPPTLYTEAGLLSAMENAGNQVDSIDQKNILKSIGIGTPATRASIIEVLFTRNYIKKQNKSLVPTKKGLQVYKLIKDKKIADVSLTAEWELELQKIEMGDENLEGFLKSIEHYTLEVTNELLAIEIPKQNIPKLICPKCKKEELLFRDKFVKCSDELCGWIQFRSVCGKTMTNAEIQLLVEKRKTSLIKGMKSRSGKSFDAFIILDDKAESSFEFVNTTKKK